LSAKPRLLVIERDVPTSSRRHWDEEYDVVVVRSMARALVLLRQGAFAGVFVDSGQLTAVRWAGLLIQSDDILEAIADGVAVVDGDLRLLWCNPEFSKLADIEIEPTKTRFYQALGSPEVLGPDPCPFTTAVASRSSATTVLRAGANRFLRITVTPVFESPDHVDHLITLTRDVTGEVLQEQRINAINKAGEELADLMPEELSEMELSERTELLKYKIGRHMKELLGREFVEIRLLDRATGNLEPLLSVGMSSAASVRTLRASRDGNGVTGYVAATGMSYLCPDTVHDPLYIEGAPGARSALTVPLIHHGMVIGTLNVENAQPGAFDERDRQFLEIYARNVAAALYTLELLEAEKQTTATDAVEAIGGALALPIDDILNDATIVLDRYAGHDEEIINRLRHLLLRAREIRGLVVDVGASIAPETHPGPEKPPARFADARLLVVDAEEAIRKDAHHLLGREGATVETARDAHEAIALARQSEYSAALVDIRLPDMDGYESYRKLREVQPSLPIILMTGFGYDPTHSIVKARQEGLQSVLYKPFRSDRLMEAVEQSLRTPRPPTDGRLDPSS
jgi:two-component system, sensor histidine kinase SagS